MPWQVQNAIFADHPSRRPARGLSLRRAARSLGVLSLGAFSLGALSLGLAAPATAAPPKPAGAHAIEAALTLSPRRPLLAHVRFCLVYEGQCDTRPDRRDPARTAADHLDELRALTAAVNAAITPTPDAGFDSWDINVRTGDCEDFALQKRADLLARGWPSADLRLAITRLPSGVAHAVLLVRVGGTDHVLDNLTDRVLRWDQTGYDYLMVQGRADPRSWYDLAPARAARSAGPTS